VDQYQFNGVDCRTGGINDVGTLPGYGGKGIGRKLMEQAVAFMKAEGCEYSVLSADPRGFPRSKLYLPLGWKDYFMEQVWVSIIGSSYASKLAPLLLPFVPALFTSRFIRETRICQIAKKLARHGIEARLALPYRDAGLDRALSRQLWRFHEAVAPRQLDGYTRFPIDDWIYFRERPIARDLWPVYAVITKKGEIAGYASFMRQRMTRTMGMRFPIGFAREFLVDHSIASDAGVVADAYMLLAGKAWEAAIKDACLALVYVISPNDKHLVWALKALGFFHVPGGMFMVNPLGQPGSSLPPLTRPFFVNPGENFGYP
jgi:predicted GNAT family acetyltransferase